MSRRSLRTVPEPERVALSAPMAERALIATVVDADTHRANHPDMPDVIAMVGGTSLLPAFTDRTHYRIWEVLCERHRRGESNDLMAAAEVLRNERLPFAGAMFGASDLAGWVLDLVEATDAALPALCTTYAREIRDLAARRGLIDAARALFHELEHNQRSLSSWYSAAAAPLLQAITPAVPEPSLSDRVSSLMIDVGTLLEFGRPHTAGIPTGLTGLDIHTGGFRRGDLIVVAGRTGLGKTALALTVTLNAALRGFGVCFASCEMPTQSLLQRLLSQLSGVEISRLWRGPLSSRDHAHLVANADRLSKLALQFVDLKRSWPEIVERCQRAVGEGAQLVIIDYLGLLTIPGSKLDRWEMIGTITAEAKQLALTTSVPVVLLCQLNREVSRETNKRPALWHLRDSGCVEQDSDLVLFVHREHAYDRAARADLAELIIAKFRNGPTGVVTARWRGELARFEDEVTAEDDDASGEGLWSTGQ